MLDFSQVQLTQFSAAWVGNKNRYEGVSLPKTTVALSDLAEEMTLTSMLKPFSKVSECFIFKNLPDGESFPLSVTIDDVFTHPDRLTEAAKTLANSLYDASENPKVKGGDFFVAYFEGLMFEGEAVSGIGLWKVQSTNPYLRTDRTNADFQVTVTDGIPTNKIETAALILNTSGDHTILTIDKVSKRNELSFWSDEFLKLEPMRDDFYYTRHLVGITSEFIAQKLQPRFGRQASITASIKSADYFQDYDEYELKNFCQEVFPDDTESFKTYIQAYEDAYGLVIPKQVNLNRAAVKKGLSLLGVKLKLDKNFIIDVKARPDCIEFGQEEEGQGRNFIKIFFDNIQ